MTPVLPRVSYAAVAAGARPSAASSPGASTGSTAPTFTALGATAAAPSPPQTLISKRVLCSKHSFDKPNKPPSAISYAAVAAGADRSAARSSAALPEWPATTSAVSTSWPIRQVEDTAYWESYNASWQPREPDDFSSLSSSSSPATTPSTSPTSSPSPISSPSSSPPTRDSSLASPSTVTWTRPATNTGGNFAKFRGYRTFYVAGLESCASASEFEKDIEPELDDACRKSARFILALHHEMFDRCMDYLRRCQVPAELVTVYYGSDNDGPKRRALERQGYRVKYVKGDGERVNEVLLTDSEPMI